MELTPYLKSCLTKVNSLRGGAFLPPGNVDIHPDIRCNSACTHCIGGPERGSVPIRALVSPLNIGHILDRALDGFAAPPFIHFAGFTGDPFFGVCQHDGTLTGLTCTTAEGIIHLIRKGWNFAENIAVVTNGVGLADNIETPQGIKEHSFAELLAYIGFAQVSLDASTADQYKKTRGVDLFDHVMGNISSLNFWRKAYGLDYHGILDRYGLAEDIPRSSPMKLYVNYVLTDGNCDIAAGFIEKLISYQVDSLRFRVDLFRTNDLSFQQRMFETVSGLEERYADSGLEIFMKSPDTPINRDSFDVCFAPLFWPAVGMDGQVYVCAHNVRHGQQIGSLWERPLLDILKDYQEGILSGDIGLPDCNFMCPSTVGKINLISALEEPSLLPK